MNIFLVVFHSVFFLYFFSFHFILSCWFKKISCSWTHLFLYLGCFLILFKDSVFSKFFPLYSQICLIRWRYSISILYTFDYWVSKLFVCLLISSLIKYSVSSPNVSLNYIFVLYTCFFLYLVSFLKIAYPSDITATIIKYIRVHAVKKWLEILFRKLL